MMIKIVVIGFFIFMDINLMTTVNEINLVLLFFLYFKIVYMLSFLIILAALFYRMNRYYLLILIF